MRVETRYQERGGWRGRIDFLRFCRRSFSLSRQYKPDVIIGVDVYGFLAAFAAGFSHRSAKLIYHNFDLVPSEGLSPFMRLLKGLELFAARRAHKVMVSSPGRADILQEQAQLKEKPLVIMNCQRLNANHTPTGELNAFLRSQGLSFDRLVVRLGMLGPGNAVDTTIRSVAEWRGNWGMIFAGVPVPGFLEKMRELVKRLDLEKRVVFLPSISYGFWYDCLNAADLGIALYVPENVNNQTMAGAGYKLNLYLSAGIPSIVPALPDFVDFAEKFGAGEVAEASDPHAIARAVNEVLSDPQKQAVYSANAQRAFESEYNFETQYSPILNYVNQIGRN